MSTCGDVYTLAAPAGCGNVWAFPSQIHPRRRVRPSGPRVNHIDPRIHPVIKDMTDDDDDVMTSLALLDLL